MGREVPVSERVVRAVAEREGVDPGRLEPPLYEVVDPDALDRLATRGDGSVDVRVEFTYGDWIVVVENGTVRCERRQSGRNGSNGSQSK